MKLFRRDVLDVGLAAIDGVDFPPVGVDANDPKPCIGEGYRQRQANVAKPYDTDKCLALVEFFSQIHGVALGYWKHLASGL